MQDSNNNMNEWQSKPSESYTEIFKYLKAVYRDIRGKIKFPVPIPQMQNVYSEFLTKEFRDKMYEECPDLQSLGDENIEKLLEHHVLNPLTTKNFLSLKQKVEGIVVRFLGELNFMAEIDEVAAKDFVDKRLADTDEAILEFVKTISRDVNTVDEVTYSILNNKLQTILSVIRYSQQSLYLKYQCSDYLSVEIERIRENTIELILTELDISHAKLLRDINKVLKKSFDLCAKRFNQISEGELVEMYLNDPKVSNYIQAYKSIFQRLVTYFKDNVAAELGEEPGEVFMFNYVKEIKEMLEKTVIVDKLYKTVLQDPTKLKTNVYEELDQIFHDFFMTGAIPKLFDQETLGGRENLVTVYRIMLLTDYVEFHEQRYELYFEILERVYMGFVVDFAEKEEKSIKDIWEMISTKENYMNNRAKLNQMLAAEMEKWASLASEYTNYFALMSVFMVFNIVPAENMSSRYTNHLRCMLKCVFRNYQNGMYRFTNFQILCALESLILEYKKPMRKKSLRRMDTAPIQREILEKIRTTNITSYEQQAEYKEQLASLEDQIKANITKPNKFIFEKISNPEVKSKCIIICVSGFTSEDCTKTKEWRGIPEAFPNTEVLALHWRSSTMDELFEFVINEANNVVKEKEGFLFGFALPSMKSLKLGIMAYKAIKGIANNQWGTTYKEAITTGIYLAHILAETDLFRDYVVNLVAFSLGTMVMMNCIWELERMNRHDVIYDVLLMGGVVNVGDFNQGAMSVIGHKLINCYCYNDYILRYVLKAANFGTSPIGLGPILSPNQKVENLDVTKEVDGHTKYRENLYNIIARIDFNEDFRYMIRE